MRMDVVFFFFNDIYLQDSDIPVSAQNLKAD